MRETMNKKHLSEQDICLRYITPALEQSGWDKMTQIRTEYTFTAGRVIVRGNLTSRDKKTRYRADYILSYKDSIPLAVVEAKDNNHTVSDGIQQAIKYAKMLDIPFAYSSNGDGFVEHDFTTGEEREITMEQFPSPSELWNKYLQWKNITTKEQEEIITEPFHYELGGDTPRYYQKIAVNRVLEAVAKNRKRILLTMATGTGKTFTAFQIMWRLKQSKKVNKILFLADRNILVDQSLAKDFAPFGNIATKVQNKVLNSAYEIHLALYQQLVSNEGEDTYKQFTPDFFDLIIIDECHRGSASEASAWRKVLNYFSSAIHLGMTATPKETNDVSNIEYFGDPVYTYSLAQGIKDGFLAPYKVIRVHLDKDLLGYRPEKGKTDIYGNIFEDRVYNTKDFDKTLVIDERTKVVARKLTEYLKKNDRMMKTIIFCIDTEHASRMRQALINENMDMVKEDDRYVMRITGNDDEGKAQLENFIAVDEKYPVIAVTSELMTTGVDAKMTKLIVIDKEIESMITFKQVVGRGTRIREEDGKMYFTLMDFRNVSRKFADPAFDGDPVQIKIVDDDDDMPDDKETDDATQPDDGDSETPGGTTTPNGDGYGYGDDDDGGDPRPPKEKIYVNGVTVTVLKELVQYLDKDGKLITESLKDYSKKQILEQYHSIDDFIKRWSDEKKKQVIIDELESQGVIFEALKEQVGKNFDAFDLVMHVAFDKPPLSRSERVNNVKKRGYLYKYSDQAKQVLETLLGKYMDDDVVDFGSSRILKLPELSKFGSPVAIKNTVFGGSKEYEKTIEELETLLYEQSS